MVNKRGLSLFLATGIFWGLPYFFIAIAVEDFSTESIVFARTFIGALILIPYAMKTGALKLAFKAWPWVLAFGVLEMLIPWWLITEAGRHISSGLSGLLVATVPFFAVAILAIFFKDRSALRPVPLSGMVLGFIGVVSLVGVDSLLGQLEPFWVLAVVTASLGYAIAPIMANRKMTNVPTSGVIGLSMLFVAIMYAPAALSRLPQELAKSPEVDSLASVVALGVICSAIAFVLFFELLKEVGPVRASLITYLNTAVALLLGVSLLGEPITPGLLLGVPLIATGLYLSARK